MPGFATYDELFVVHRSSLHRRVLSFAVLIAFGIVSAIAHADTGSATAPTQANATTAALGQKRQAIYAELLGKGGLWGVGYDYQFHRRLAIGATASFYVTDGERILTFSPYLVGYLLGTGRHRWFLQGGPQLTYVYTPSPVPEWPGASVTGVGAELCSGYEYRRGVIVRVFGMGTVGKNGIAPWMGVSLGWTL